MSLRSEKEKTKQIEDRCQNLLNQMLRDEDNKYCVDCDSKGPRWASWNLGIFLCIRCAGIHRNLGVHISKVKSVNLDSWTPEQVVSLQQMGNSRARAVYEANLPESFRRPQTDSALESFIRAKYEAKKYIAQEWVPPPPPKVNWDKELEEEAEKLRKKKRDIKNTAPVTIPKKIEVIPQALPKPTSSPKNRDSKIGRSRGNSGGTSDLLALDTPTTENPSSANDNVFTDFLSANSDSLGASGGPIFGGTTNTGSTNPPKVEKKQRSDEEESFFNQSLNTTDTSGNNSGNSTGKLTTDSILALYSKGPPIPTVQNFGPVGQPMGFMPSNLVQQPTLPVFNGPTNFSQNPQNFAPNPFYSMQNVVPNVQNQPNFVQPTPQNDLSQQLGNLNLGNPGQHQNSLPHQLWQ